MSILLGSIFEKKNTLALSLSVEQRKYKLNFPPKIPRGSQETRQFSLDNSKKVIFACSMSSMVATHLDVNAGRILPEIGRY